MNHPNPLRISIMALSLMCLPALAQTVVAKPSPTVTNAPAATPEVIATPASTPGVAVAPEPAAKATPDATVTATPTATATPTPAANPEMAKMQTTMTENMAKSEAADIAMKAHMDSQTAGAKSDMEMKHAIIDQLQKMSEQIQQLNDRITALSTPPATPVKAAKPKPAKEKVRPPLPVPAT